LLNLIGGLVLSLEFRLGFCGYTSFRRLISSKHIGELYTKTK
jgi:hypothetical protein